MTQPVIAISMGDPAGIGPELMLKLLAQSAREPIGGARLLVVGSDGLLKRHAAAFKLPYAYAAIRPAHIRRDDLAADIVADVGSSGDERIPPGKPTASSGELSMTCVGAALDLVRKGVADALVTGPISKQAIGMAGFRVAGHTDYLAERLGVRDSVMMLVARSSKALPEGLRVGLVTHHIALADVPKSLATESVLSALRVMHKDLARYFGLKAPRIAVAGLNPHASDGGRFGNEEARIIAPAVERAKGEGIACDGPHPPDTLFTPVMRGRHDAFLAMYHDQGLIPLKMLAFGRAVNLTLGLPIVRTSVDHGTAYDIAGKGVASTESLVEAVRLAVEIVQRAAAS